MIFIVWNGLAYQARDVSGDGGDGEVGDVLVVEDVAVVEQVSQAG